VERLYIIYIWIGDDDDDEAKWENGTANQRVVHGCECIEEGRMGEGVGVGVMLNGK